MSVASDQYIQNHAGGSENRSILNQAIHSTFDTVWHEQSQTRNEVENYTAELITAIPFFVAGARGYTASAVLSGLNQARVGDTSSNQLEDFSLGALKGVATKATIDYFGAKENWNFAAKGVGMGACSRALDQGLTRQTYSNGIFNGLENTVMTSLQPTSLLTDVALLGVANYGLNIGKAIPRIEANPFLANIFTGTSFGFTSGALGEVQHQWNDPNAQFDPLKILERGTASAVTNTVAAGAGFKLTSAAHMQPVIRFETTNELTPPAGPYSNERVSMLQQAAGLIPEVRSREYMRALRDTAYTDGLTGLIKNPHSVLEREIARATRDNTPLSIVYADLNGFKGVNDTFGHQMGDRTLTTVADAISSFITRGSDTLTRKGDHGDEFITVLPGANLENSQFLMNRLAELRIAVNRDSPRVMKPEEQLGKDERLVTIAAGRVEWMKQDAATLLTHGEKLMKVRKQKMKGTASDTGDGVTGQSQSDNIDAGKETVSTKPTEYRLLGPLVEWTDKMRKALPFEVHTRNYVRDLKTRGEVDEMTGLMNKSAGLKELQKEVARTNRKGEPLTIVAADLDGFKSINDKLGYDHGNKALKYFADFLQTLGRQTDIKVRNGGDEFLVIFPAATLEQVSKFQEQLSNLRVAVGRNSIRTLAPTEMPATDELLMGVSSAARQRLPGESADRLLDETDALAQLEKARRTKLGLRKERGQ